MPKAGIGNSGAIQRTISKDGKYQIAESLRSLRREDFVEGGADARL